MDSPVIASSPRNTQGGVPPASISEPIQHLLIHVSGTVQGVGFRPFIYNLAARLGVKGNVLNSNEGVILRVEGDAELLAEFVGRIRSEAPPAARIARIDSEVQPLAYYTDFRILPSEHVAHAFTHIPPDLALCAECRRELDDPSNRRYRYPFINCIHCGPRFSIVKSLPYDRPVTTLSVFEMCDVCRGEYDTPSDRRFHTQPISCPNCGPTLTCLESKETSWVKADAAGAELDHLVRSLQAGRIALIQGIGGFHLACDARSDEAVRELRRRKHREEKPLALMFPSLPALRAWCEVAEAEVALLCSPRAPIVLVRKRERCPVAPSVAPGNPYLGVMLPYSPLHLLVLERFGFPIVLTSANASEEPIAYSVDDALKRMHTVADVAVVHDREIYMFADDSVVRVLGESPVIWRRARGYVPEAVPVTVAFRTDTLAFGPQLKNTFCVGKGNLAILSQHLGDMDSEVCLAAQAKALAHFSRLYDVTPGLLACDLHPDYATTRIAEEWSAEHSLPLIRVQHHHAHLVSCLADNGMDEPAIGLCLDGTGYGTDGAIWGGEVLVGDARDFRRVAHLEYTSMLGGEQATREPWRMALAWLATAFADEVLNLNLPLIKGLRTEIGEEALGLLLSPTLRDSFPMTSSLGRLFDAAAALTFFGTKRQYEGQAAMQFEWLMSGNSEKSYELEIAHREDVLILSPRSMIQRIVSDLQTGVPPDVISRRFHQSVISAFVEACVIARERYGIAQVALSGGCFQNAFLHTEFKRELEARHFRVIIHRQVPPNDGGVSLGQAVVAKARRM